MKNGWKKVIIGHLGKIVTGKTPPPVHQEYYGGPYPFITPTDLEYDIRFVETERTVSEEGYEYQKQLILPPKATCFVCIGATIGKICQTTKESFTNQQINSIIANDDSYDSNFIYYLLRTQECKIKSIAGGAATPIVSKSSFSNVEVIVPQYEQQKYIAFILSTYDYLIENNTRRIKILEEMAWLIYREWFVEFKAPNIKLRKATPEEKKVTGRDVFPERWEVKRLEEVATITMGQSPESKYYNETGEGLPFHQGVTNFGDRFPKDRVFTTIQNRMADEGDILFSVRAPVGRINIATKRLVLGRGLSGIRSKLEQQEFLFQQLKESFKEEDTIGGGTIFKSVTKNDMLSIRIIQPIKELVKLFQDQAKPIFEELFLLTKQNTNLHQTRDLLLPKLISGEVEV